MYITPNTQLRLLYDIPLDNTYKNTLYFESMTQQINFFIGKTKLNFTELSYQRIDDGVLRIDVNPGDVYNCNYMMFQNTAYDNTWFYAFITNVEYVNNACTYIYYEIDVMQTWFFHCTLKESFVVREHPLTDKPGDNLQGESLPIGEYVCNYTSKAGLSQSHIIIMALSAGVVSGGARGMMCGIYQGIEYYGYDITEDGVNRLNNDIDTVTEKNQKDGIVCIFMASKEFFDMTPFNTSVVKNYEHSRRPSNLDGYTPRNKKLLTYPYCFVLVNNSMGATATYRYEFFDETKNNMLVTFELSGEVSCNPSVLLQPKNYKGATNGYNECLVIDGFPQCPYAIDSYKAWVAQNVGVFGINMITNIVTGQLLQMAINGPSNDGLNLMNYLGDANNQEQKNITSTMAAVHTAGSLSKQTASAIAESSRGLAIQGSISGNAMYARGALDFWCYNMSINAEYARKIDSYFDMFGYATNEVKVPRISGRPHWNYVEVKNCNINGHCPSSDLSLIKRIYERGITFWRNADEVGDYSLDNSAPL